MNLDQYKGLVTLVCGGRDFTNRTLLYATLDALEPSLIVEGGAAGADRLAAQWAHSKGVDRETHHANWYAFGYNAGPLRNRRMLERSSPRLVVGFPGPISKGTWDMLDTAWVNSSALSVLYVPWGETELKLYTGR